MSYQLVEHIDMLDEVPLPEETATYKPVPYNDFIEYARDALRARGVVMNTNRLELARDGQQMFGTFEVYPMLTEDGESAVTGAEPYRNEAAYRRMLGLRTSYDKSLPNGIIMGAQLIVCSNLMFSGEFLVTRRHTKNVLNDLPSDVFRLVGRGLEGYSDVVGMLEWMKGEDVGHRQMLNDFVVRSMREGVINSGQILRVLKEFENPTFGIDGRTNSVYNLHNAFTHVIKKVNPISIVPRISTLTEMCKQEWEYPSEN